MNQYYETWDAWKIFVSTGSIPVPNSLSKIIADSWIRSKDYGVDPHQKKVPVVLKGKKLQDLLDRNKNLIDTSKPFLENLYLFVKGSGFITALVDVNGYIIDIIGDEDELAMVKKANFVVGALWSEDKAGTNMIAILLKINRPSQICSSEHFCRMAHRVTGSGAPIHNPEGRLIGGFTIFGPHEKANPHTLGMVVASAHAIENSFLIKRSFLQIEMAHNFAKKVIESIPEALIVLNSKGKIALVNENAARMLELPENTTGQNIRDVIGTDNNKLVNVLMGTTSLIDEEVSIVRNGQSKRFLLTCNSIFASDDKHGEKIIVLNEIVRTKALVNRMVGAKANFHFNNIIGAHPRALESVNLGKKAARTLSNVLLLGESGTGKNVFAQAIHNESQRAQGPFVSINCGAIPRELIASELFGYAEGAFTGSKKGGNPGKFELADGGTLCLDEIGEMPIDLQTSLLNVIEDKSIIRIGGREVVPVDVRIIATTNKNLKIETENGNFREDLYYRLNVFTIEMVPLRMRRSDIVLLANYFVKKLANRLARDRIKIDKKVIDAFLDYPWPGNVRELQNVIERVLNISATDVITIDALPPEVTRRNSIMTINNNMSIQKMEQHLISEMMTSDLSKSDIAKKLNITRCTLYRKLKKYGIPY